MYEVIMDENLAKKYFVMRANKNDAVPCPRNDEMFNYVKNEKYLRIYKSLATFESYKNFKENSVEIPILDGFIKILTFEFETEEEAFYFKMKYC